MWSLRAGSVGGADWVGHQDTGNTQLSVRAQRERFFQSKDRVNFLHEHPSEPQNGIFKLHNSHSNNKNTKEGVYHIQKANDG